MTASSGRSCSGTSFDAEPRSAGPPREQPPSRSHQSVVTGCSAGPAAPRGASGNDVAPPPTPTSRTSPRSPSASTRATGRDRRVRPGSLGPAPEQLRREPPRRLGAFARISSGIAQPASSRRHRSSALTPRARRGSRPCARPAAVGGTSPAAPGRRRGSDPRRDGAHPVRGRRSPGSRPRLRPTRRPRPACAPVRWGPPPPRTPRATRPRPCPQARPTGAGSAHPGCGRVDRVP